METNRSPEMHQPFKKECSLMKPPCFLAQVSNPVYQESRFTVVLATLGMINEPSEGHACLSFRCQREG